MPKLKVEKVKVTFFLIGWLINEKTGCSYLRKCVPIYDSLRYLFQRLVRTSLKSYYRTIFVPTVYSSSNLGVINRSTHQMSSKLPLQVAAMFQARIINFYVTHGTRQIYIQKDLRIECDSFPIFPIPIPLD